MKGGGFDSTLEEIKAKCNIVDVISSVVELKKAGANYKGLCPFHGEKTPSFMVSENKQIYTCFGCGAGGDVISFVEKYYGLSFMEAVEKLANQYNIDISNFKNHGNAKDKKKYKEICRKAGIYFYKNLRSEDKNPGHIYMAKRGITNDTLNTFGIGFASDNWHDLVYFLKRNEYTEKDMLEMGLVSKGKNNKIYDKFRNRIIFPIQNSGGMIIGFGGRAIDDAMPKYLNSPETKLFLKKNNLYALNITKPYIIEENLAILVEGYMDVISLYQRGIKNVTASLGTAFTENQGKLLRRASKNVAICYDSDNAGINAALRAGQILRELDFEVRVITIPDGKDPDEFISKKGSLAFKKLVDDAIPFVEFYIAQLAKRYKIKNPNSRLQFLKEVSKYLMELSGIEREIFAQRISDKYGVSKGALLMQGEYENHNIKPDLNVKNQGINNNRDIEKFAGKLYTSEKELIKIAIMDPACTETINSMIDEFKMETVFPSLLGRQIYELINSETNIKKDIDLNKIIDSLGPEVGGIISEIENMVGIKTDLKNQLEAVKNKVEASYLSKQEQEIIAMLSMADSEVDDKKIAELTNKLMEIQSKLRSL